MRTIALVLGIVSGCAKPQPVEPVVPGRDFTAAPDLTQRVTDYVTPYVEMNDFRGRVLIARDEALLYDATFAAAPTQVVSPQTRYAIGPVTESFTAAAIVLLQRRGRLELADPLSRHLPEFLHGSVTIEHLLVHSAGVPNLRSLPEALVRRGEPIALAEFAGLVGSKPLDFQPGTMVSHSDTGYTLLALVVERVSGQDYATFVQSELLTPVRLADTGQLTAPGPIEDLAPGYAPGPKPHGVEPAVPMHPSWLVGSASMYSTPDDLQRWTRALRRNELFAFSQLAAPYGWQRRTMAGRTFLVQAGSVPTGHAAHVSFLPDDGLTIIALSNIETGVMDRLALDLAALELGEPVDRPTVRRNLALSPQVLAQYEGRYELSPGVVLTVSQRDGGLRLAGPSGDLGILDAQAEAEFFSRTEYATLRFQRDGSGHVIALQWNGTAIARRVE